MACHCYITPVQGVNSSSDLFIMQLHWGSVQIYNTTLTCMVSGSATSTVAPPVTLVAETSQQLLQGIRLLGQLQPFTIMLARDMDVPADTWPKGLLVNKSMVLAGLPPPAPRTLLDLYQVRHRVELWGAGGGGRWQVRCMVGLCGWRGGQVAGAALGVAGGGQVAGGKGLWMYGTMPPPPQITSTPTRPCPIN